MKKKLSLLQLFIAIVVCCGTTFCLASCSSDDEEDFFKDVTVNLSLLNENSEKVSTFKYGENIYFDMYAINNTDQGIYLTDNIYYNRYSLYVFAIYTADGLFVGFPYDFLHLSADKYELLPKGTIHWQSCWGIDPEEGAVDDIFIINVKRNPLPIGDYYTVFSFLYNGERKVYKASFRVID